MIKLLFILNPREGSNPLLTKKLSEITIKMDRNWKVYAISGSENFSHSMNLRCPFELYTVSKIGSSKGPFMMILYLIFCILKGIRLVREKKIHVIMCKGGHSYLGLVAYIISRLTNRRCIIRVSSDFLLPLLFFLRDSGNPIFKNKAVLTMISFVYRRIEIYIFKHADWVVTHGPGDFERIREVTDRVTFVPLWIDLEKFRPMDKESIKKLKSKFIDEKDGRILLFVGRLHPAKDVATVLRALKIISGIYDNILLILVGTGDYEEEYKQMARRLGIINKTLFLGYVPHDELPKYYNVADIYILTSFHEQWSNTIMEAMACKVPVIASDSGSNPYLISEGETGFLVPVQNPTSLAQKIEFVLKNTNWTKKVCEKAFNEIKRYNKDEIAELHKSVITNVISRAHHNQLHKRKRIETIKFKELS